MLTYEILLASVKDVDSIEDMELRCNYFNNSSPSNMDWLSLI